MRAEELARDLLNSIGSDIAMERKNRLRNIPLLHEKDPQERARLFVKFLKAPHASEKSTKFIMQ